MHWRKSFPRLDLEIWLPKLHLGLVVNEIYPTKCPPLLIGGCSTDIIARNSPPIKLSANPSYGKEPIKRRLDFKHSPLWKYLPRKVFFLVLPCCSPSRFPFQLLLFLCWGCMWCWVEGCCYCSLFTRFSRTTSEAAASTRRRTTGKWRRGESSNR